MLELRTLGTIDLRGDRGERIPAVLFHSKRISLLAYLCTSWPSRLYRRDTLAALLWPELDEAHARGALRHELWELRRALGREVLRGDGAEALGADDARIWCDVQAFEAARAEGRPADALALWQGEFLPGLHTGSGGFDRWLDETRDRLARRAMEEARRLVADAEGAGDPAGAVFWARWLTELAPYDETGWQRLMVILDRVGDRAEALTAYDELALRLREELEVDPSPETRALARRIRERAEAFATVPSGAAGPSPLLSPTIADPATRPPGVVISLGAVENRTGDSTVDLLASRLTDRMAHGLAHLDYVRLARGGGPANTEALVSASLYGEPGRIEARASLAEPGEGGRILEIPEPVMIEGEPVDATLDALVARILTAVHMHFDPHMGGGTDRMPFALPSWEAYQESTRGAELFGQLRFTEAAGHLRRAYELDHTHLNAALFAGIALMYAGEPAAAETLAREALREAAPLPEYERYFGEWLLAALRGRRAEAYRAAMEARRVSGYPPARLIAGLEAGRMNRPRQGLEMIRDITLRQGWWSKWPELWERGGGALHVLADHGAELSTVLGGRGAFPDSLELVRAEIRARAALRQSGEVMRLVNEGMTLSPGPPVAFTATSPAQVAWVAAQELEHHGDAGCAAEARRIALRWLAHRKDPTHSDLLLRARLLLESGDATAAWEHLLHLSPTHDPEALGLRGLVAAALGDGVAAEESLAALERVEDPYICGRHLLLAAGIEAALDRADAAVDTLRRAFAEGLPFGVELHALPILRPLAGRADFIELLRPRG